MSDANNFISSEGLKFFGKVNASISHELKNIFAIISETAGFLNDLTDLAKQGESLNISLLENCGESIAEDIQRGFSTIKRMNQFAHSVDVPIKEIDISETVELTVKLSSFLSFSSNVQIENGTWKNKSVLTCPFLMQSLIYQILIFVYESVGTDGNVLIQFDSPKDTGTALFISIPPQHSLDEFPTPDIQQTADFLGVRFNLNTLDGKLDIWIPYVSNEIVALAKKLNMNSKG